MSQIRQGLVSVTNGSATVTSDDNANWSSVAAGHLFTIAGSGVFYTVAGPATPVASHWTLTLTSNYGGTTASAQSYAIHSSFTPNYGIPYPENGDTQTASIVKRALQQVDTLILNSVVPEELQTKIAGIVVNPRSFGAVHDGTTNDRPAIQAAIDFVSAAGGGVVLCEAGVYALLTSLTVKDRVTIAGQGESTVLRIITNNTQVLSGSLASLNSFEVRDLTLQGYAVTDASLGTDSSRLLVVNANAQGYLRCSNVYFKDSRQMGFTCNVSFVEVINCRFDTIYRDGFNATGSKKSKVIGCKFKNIGDDAVAHHLTGSPSSSQLDFSCEVIGCTFEMTFGVKTLGLCRVVVCNNNFDRVKGYAVHIAVDGSFTEGYATLRDIVISSNVIRNVLNHSAFGGGNVQHAIYIAGDARAGDSSYNAGGGIPDTYSTSIPGWTIPETASDFLTRGQNTPLAPISPPNRIIIANNIIAQQLPSGVSYSTFGYGNAFPTNPSVNVVRYGSGLTIVKWLTKALITGNIFYGWSSCVNYLNFAGTEQNDFRDVLFSNNQFFRFNQAFSYSGTGRLNATNVEWRSNTFDCDPLHESADRSSTGTWNNSGTSARKALVIPNVVGMVMVNNSFKNMKSAVHTDGNSIYKNISPIYYFSPINNSFNFGGIYQLDNSRDAVCVEIGADPTTAATYNKVIRINDMKNTQAASIPTAGWFAAGVFVRNTAPSKDANNMVLIGWMRMTSGTAHVSGTDWNPLYGSAVSPAT